MEREQGTFLLELECQYFLNSRELYCYLDFDGLSVHVNSWIDQSNKYKIHLLGARFIK